MTRNQEDGFVVYIRTDPSHAVTPDDLEKPIANCPSYEDALRLQRACHGSSRDCVIRYEGVTGGGD